jgi:hypothetical protein
MSVKNEAAVKDKIRSLLASMPGIDHIAVVTRGMTRRGVSDVIVNWRGCFVALEVKATEKGLLRGDQAVFLLDTLRCGGLGLVVHEGNWRHLRELLTLPAAEFARRRRLFAAPVMAEFAGTPRDRKFATRIFSQWPGRMGLGRGEDEPC